MNGHTVTCYRKRRKRMEGKSVTRNEHLLLLRPCGQKSIIFNLYITNAAFCLLFAHWRREWALFHSANARQTIIRNLLLVFGSGQGPENRGTGAKVTIEIPKKMGFLAMSWLVCIPFRQLKKKIPWWWNEYACLSAINRRRWPTNWHAVPSEDVSVRSLSNHKTCNFSNKKHIHRNEEGTSAFAKEKSHISEDGQISNFEAGLLLKMVTRTLIITNLNQRPAPFCILNASTSIRTQVEKNKSARICAET